MWPWETKGYTKMNKEDKNETTINRKPRERRDVSHQEPEKLRRTTENKMRRGTISTLSFDASLGDSNVHGEEDEEHCVEAKT